ncbi:hypothetical protein WJX72_005903 [[Myrmecia] bisecta]|uniref:Uncharacterized protein n=1 Tax=[Myrmecia] bisecta TaxID=41462 RepID=A0AAW1Q5Q5_9CHLO
MVLGQVLSRSLSKQYERQLQLYRQGRLQALSQQALVQLLSPVEGCPQATTLEQALLQYITRYIGEAASRQPGTFMATLPADIPVSPQVEPYAVTYGTYGAFFLDAHKQLGLRAKAQSHGVFPSSALMYGNATALVNDPRSDPLNNPDEPVGHLANTRILEFQVGCWVFPFMATIKGARKGA